MTAFFKDHEVSEESLSYVTNRSTVKLFPGGPWGVDVVVHGGADVVDVVVLIIVEEVVLVVVVVVDGPQSTSVQTLQSESE